MSESNKFKFEVVEQLDVPCAGCFWGGAGLVLGGVAIAISVT